MQAAEAYSKMWGSGQPADAGTFVESGFHEMDPLLGNEIKSREELEKAIKSLGLVSSHFQPVTLARRTSCDHFLRGDPSA